MLNINIPTPAELKQQRFERAVAFVIEQLHTTLSPKSVYISQITLASKAAYLDSKDLEKLCGFFEAKGWKTKVTIDHNSFANTMICVKE